MYTHVCAHAWGHIGLFLNTYTHGSSRCFLVNCSLKHTGTWREWYAVNIKLIQATKYPSFSQLQQPTTTTPLLSYVRTTTQLPCSLVPRPSPCVFNIRVQRCLKNVGWLGYEEATLPCIAKLDIRTLYCTVRMATECRWSLVTQGQTLGESPTESL